MLKNWKRNTAFFLISQIVSLLGTALVQYAMSWYILLETKSGAMVTISIIVGFLPSFLVSPFAGVWADRFNKKKIIAFSDSFTAVVTLVLAVVFLAGKGSILAIFVVMGLRAFGQGIQQPSVASALPLIVPEDKLMRVNGLHQMLTSAMTLLAPLLAGLLMTFTSVEVMFFIDVVTAAIAVIFLTFLIKIPYLKSESKEKISYFGDIKDAIGYIKTVPFLKVLFAYSAFFMLMAGPIAFLSPLQVTRNYGDNKMYLAYLEMVFSGGMLIGSLVMMSWGGFKNRHFTMALAYIVFAAGTFAIGFPLSFAVYLGLFAVLGVSMPMYNTTATVLIQQRVDPKYLGRVFSLLGMASTLSMPVSILVFGPLSDIVSIESLLLFTGGALLIASGFMSLNKTLVASGQETEKNSDQADING